MCVCVCVCVYEGGLKSSYNDVISAIDDFLTSEIQTLQQRRKKYFNHKREYDEKINLIWSHSMKAV